MATTPMDSWAVDLSTLGPVYPFVGSEMLMVILAVVFWVGWHILQISAENRLLKEEHDALLDPASLSEAVRKTNGT